MIMPRSTFSACVLLLCFICYSVGVFSREAENDNLDITSVRVYSMDWETLTNDAQTVESLVEYSQKMGFSTTIKDNHFCRLLREMLSEKRADYEYRLSFPMNVRTVCFVERSSGAVDTLSFNNFEYFRYNQDYLQLDTLLLDHVVSALPHGQALNLQELKPYWTD